MTDLSPTHPCRADVSHPDLSRPDLSNAAWRTSSHSTGSNGACVEVAPLSGAVAVRDSKYRDGGVHVYPGAAFAALVRDIAARRRGNVSARC